MAVEQLPPQNIKAEQAFLGSMFLNGGALLKLRAVLGENGSKFYQERHGLIYEAMLKASTIDFITVCDVLERQGQLKKVGGRAYLTGLINATPTALHAESYADIIAKTAALRNLLDVAEKAVRLVYESHDNVSDIFAKVQRLLRSIDLGTSDEAMLTWFDSLLRQLVVIQEANERRKQSDVDARRVTFPWDNLRRVVPELLPGTLTAVAALPSVGKTAVLEELAEHAARQGLRTFFAHLELSHVIMLRRRLSRNTGIPLAQLDLEENWGKVNEATDRISQWPGGIDLYYCPGQSMTEILAAMRKRMEGAKIDLLIIDYLQCVRFVPGVGNPTRPQLIGDAIEECKATCGQLGIPAVIATQLDKAESRQSRPHIKGAYGGHAVWHKSNVGFTIHREVLTQPLRDSMGRLIASEGAYSPITEIYIDKNTLGATGKVGLFYDGCFRFGPLAEEEEV